LESFTFTVYGKQTVTDCLDKEETVSLKSGINFILSISGIQLELA
jgi:hypothetical protein